jgi:hypothetical protein
VFAIALVAALTCAASARAAAVGGTVFEDVAYGGGAGRTRAASSGVARPNARVELYNAAGSYLAATTTDGSGAYSFTVGAAGTYYVRVVNSTVSSSRSGYVAGTHLAVQTFRTDASSGAAVNVTDHVGGQNPTAADAPAGLAGAILNPGTGVFTAGISGTRSRSPRCSSAQRTSRASTSAFAST